MNKKEHIMNIAEALFNDFGYIAVGVDLIRDKANVSKTSMYRYFGSKNKLIEAVLIRRHQHFEEALNATAPREADVETRLDAILDWHFSWFRSVNFKGCLFIHALAEFKGKDEAIVQQALQHKAWLKSTLYSVFEPGRKDIETKTEAMMTFLEGMIIRAEFGDITDHENIYRQAIKALAIIDIPNDKLKSI